MLTLIGLCVSVTGTLVIMQFKKHRSFKIIVASRRAKRRVDPRSTRQIADIGEFANLHFSKWRFG